MSNSNDGGDGAEYRALKAARRFQLELDALKRAQHEPIAIVGHACRYPGGVSTPDEFFRFLAANGNATRRVPGDRWSSEAFYDPDPEAAGRMYVEQASFLDGDIFAFDAAFFGISPIEAAGLDPQQRLLLEATYEALEESVGALRARGTRAGVYVAMMNNDYLTADTDDEHLPYVGAGNGHYSAPNRLSYAFNLKGPSVAVDGACAGSIVAVHIANKALRNRECDLAVVGGVNAILSPATMVAISKMRALAPDGQSKAFDASANGYGRGEGCGVFVLKRLSDARRDGDRVLGTILGSSTQHGGQTAGFTVPSQVGQARLIRAALADASTDPARIQYVEAHGTGTVVGDPIEVEALSEVFGPTHAPESLPIGSVKTNVGHLEAGAGAAGLSKVLVSIKHRQLPASLHFKTPNPHIAWGSIPIRVQSVLGPWPSPERPLIAGISSFGLGGTTAHVIVSEAPEEDEESKREHAASDELSKGAKQLALCVSAKTEKALREMAERYAKRLEGLSGAETWRDVAYTANARRTHLERRAVVVGSSVEEWREQLRAIARGEMPLPRGAVLGTESESVFETEKRVVFVFSGQGTQWWGMGRELLTRSEVFRTTVEECGRYVSEHVTDWSLVEELTRDEATSRLHRTDIAQPALVALQMGLTRLLESWGIRPSKVVGHSVGEISAACASGILSLEQACMVAAVRGRVMHKASGTGKMAAVRLTGERAEEVVKTMGSHGALVVGAYNGPESVVLSGEAIALETVVKRLEAEGVETKELKVDYAFHSPQMEAFQAELGEALSSRGLTPGRSTLPMVSTVSTKNPPTCDAPYWVNQMRAPVRFASAIEAVLTSDPQAVLLEVGPHPALAAVMDEIASSSAKKSVRIVSTLRRKEDQERCVLETLGALECTGVSIDWSRLFKVRGRVVSLPTYPWQRERHSLPAGHEAKRGPRGSRGGDLLWQLIQRAPLIETHVTCSDPSGRHVLEVILDLSDGSEHAYLSDHRVQGNVWLPAAAFVEMALEAGQQIWSGEVVRVADLALLEALILEPATPVVLQLTVQPQTTADEGSLFRIASRPANERNASFTEHARGRLSVIGGDDAQQQPATSLLGEVAQLRTNEPSDSGDLYEELRVSGLEYGPAFQGIKQFWTGTNEALAQLELRDDLMINESAGYVVHPALLDAAFQTLAVAAGALNDDAAQRRTFVPTEVARIVGRPSRRSISWALVKVRKRSEDAIVCDVRILDDEGCVVVEVDGLRATAIGQPIDKLDSWLFEVVWREKASEASAEDLEGPWLVIGKREGLGGELGAWLSERGAREVEVVESGKLGDRRQKRPRKIVHVGAVDTGGSCVELAEFFREVMGQGETPRVFVVTRRSQAVRGSGDVKNPQQAMAWGFGASVVHEAPELQTTLIDIDEETTGSELGGELARSDEENRIALRKGSKRHVARLVRSHPEGTREEEGKAFGAARRLSVGSEEGYALEVGEGGRVEGLMLRSMAVPKPGPGQVVIRTKASGVNFRDVLMALGMYPGLGSERVPMGGECAGIVHAVGEGVSEEELRVGDEVVGTAVHGFDAYVVTNARLVVKKPARLSFAEAASLPTVVMTVFFALERVGRLRKGERVLIHAATGGVGLAAVQYAKHVGAEIYATAGSEAKRRYLKEEYGLKHVYDSRTLDWSEAIKRDTGGSGVNVVLNSLSGEAIGKGIEALAPFGRFLELGKRDIYENSNFGLYALRNNITMSAVALEQLAMTLPEEARELLEQTFRWVEEGLLKPLPVERYPVSRVVEAFEQLARARHIGKVVVEAEESVTARDELSGESSATREVVKSDGTYLVTGGLGGLGLVVAQRLAKLGAKSLALLGRSAPSESASAIVRELEQGGVKVHVLRGDVSEVKEMKRAMAELVAAGAPAIAGVVHAAGVLADATLMNLTDEQIAEVLAPKVEGARVLDEVLAPREIGSVARVYFASAAGILGGGGQAHYAAANAFLDACAHQHAAKGNVALSLDWGAWSEVGLAAKRGDRLDNIARQGLALLTPDQGGELFERLLLRALTTSRSSTKPLVQVAPIPIDFRQWRQANPQLAGMPLLSELMRGGPAATTTRSKTELGERLRAAVESNELNVVEDYLRGVVASVVRASPETITRTSPFKQLGFDSLMTVSMKNTLERDLSMQVSAATLFAHPTIERLAVHVAKLLGVKKKAANEPNQPPSQLVEKEVTPKKNVEEHNEPIAIVGLSARVPFERSGLTFWEGLSQRVDASIEVPSERWDASQHYDSDPRAPGKSITKRASFLKDVDRFDARFFSIAPVEAQVMDPQQRIVLETAWEALEDAAISKESMSRSTTSVFLGVCTADYGHLIQNAELPEELEPYVGTGNAASVIAGRVSYLLGLTGPCLVVDTACSSSLVAVHLACESLRNGASDIALAGGVNLILGPTLSTALSKLGALSADGRCRTFDAKGSGYGRGEGCGVIVLKRLSDARRDGDRILALIRGSAINQDGHSDGLTAPSGLAQASVVKTALSFAGLASNEVQYVEAHGTGTVLGDPIEVEALSETYGVTGRRAPLAIGSVKSNIGHLEGAAGVSGLIKTILSIRERLLPASIHFETPNPHVSWDSIRVRVQTKLGPWPSPNEPLIAGVSSFGFSGTNAHVIVSEAPKEEEASKREHAASDKLSKGAKQLALCVSAKTEKALREMAERYAKRLEGLSGAETWRDVAYTANARRTHLERRAVVVGSSVEEWREQLRAIARGEMPLPRGAVLGTESESVFETEKRVVFVFSGQGTQWWGMGRELLTRSDVFRTTVEECGRYVSEHVTDWSLVEELTRDEATSRLNRTDIAQPALVALQMGLTRLLESWGIRPSKVVGHSVGEISAACASGILSLEQACMVAAVRGRVMHKASGTGKMAAVRLTGERAEEVVKTMGSHGALVVGAYNGPESVVLSGEASALETVVKRLEAEGVETKELKVDYAFHSPQMEAFQAELGEALSSRGLTPGRSTLPMVSTVSTKNPPTCDAPYWVNQMRAPVRFASAIEAVLTSDPQAVLLEVGPHPALVVVMDEIASATGAKRSKVLSTLRRKEDQERCAYEMLGGLHCNGVTVDWKKVFGVAGRIVSLPTYSWQRERYWLPAQRKRRRSEGSKEGGRQLGAFLASHVAVSKAGNAGEHVMEAELDLTEGSEHAYLADHKVLGGVWLPAAAFVEMALEAARNVFVHNDPTTNDHNSHVELSVLDVSLAQALMLTVGESVVVQLVLQVEGGGEGRKGSFRVASRRAEEESGEWTEHARGRVRADEGTAASESVEALRTAQERCSKEIDVAELYEEFAISGLDYGKSFQGIERAWEGTHEALSKLKLIDELVGKQRRGGQNDYVIHPSLLDAAFQTLGVAVRGRESSEVTYVPTEIGAVRLKSGTPPSFAHVRVRGTEENGALNKRLIECDIELLDAAGRTVIEVEGLRATATSEPIDELDSWLFEVEWREKKSEGGAEDLEGPWVLLGGSHESDLLVEKLRQWLTVRGASKIFVADPTKEETWNLIATEQPRKLVHIENEGLDPAASCEGLAKIVQALIRERSSESQRLFVVTRRSQAVKGSADVLNPKQALAWGFGASVVHEAPELNTTLIDMDVNTSEAELGNELARCDHENRIALREGGERYVARLVRVYRGGSAKKSDGGNTFGPPRVLNVGSKEGYALEVGARGRLDGLTLRSMDVPTPGQGQVVIRTKASGINFRDVLMAVGMYPGLGSERVPMGGECAGIVHAVGEGVNDLRVGDEVVGSAAHSFDAYVIADAQLVVKKPSRLTFAEAASLPSVVMTVLFALERVARLEKGERILIHAATGGVGLAAVQYAKHVGAEIYATAGSEEKRRYLKDEYGVGHVYDSRTLDWAEAIKQDTNGAGVDVVLNSLAGEAITKGVDVLAPFGRFVELGKRDIYENNQLGLYALRNNITISAVAMDQFVLKPGKARELLEQTFRWVNDGRLKPLPVKTYPVSRAVEAFEQLARAQHIGKVVIEAEESVTARDELRPSGTTVRSAGTYLVTGGLGGLGLVVAKRLAKLGATSLALLGRNAPTTSASAIVRELEESGVRVHVLRGDVANVVEMKRAIAALLETGAPSIVGVVHAAGVLNDATLANLTAEKIATVLAPKVAGALALDEALAPNENGELLRVYFASAAGILGAGGQAHYAAANAFLDAYAHHHAAKGNVTLSLDWGAWSDVGFASRADRANNIARQGLAMLTPEQGGELFERLLLRATLSSVQIAPIPINLREWRRSAELARVPFLQALLARGTDGAPSAPDANRLFLERLRGCPTQHARLELLESYLRTTIAGVLRSELEEVPRDALFKQLGFDSLMTVTLKNTLEHDVGIRLSTAALFSNATIERLATHLESLLAAGADAPKVKPFVPPEPESEFPLTDVQEAYLIGSVEQLPFSGSCYSYTEFDWIDLDLDRLESVIARTIEAHPVLRATFHLSPARQQIVERTRFVIDRERPTSGESPEQAAPRVRETWAYATLDPTQAPLIHVSALVMSNAEQRRRTRLFINIDLLLVDFASLIRLVVHVITSYRTNEIPTSPGHFSQYVRWREWRRSTPAYNRARAYWHDRIGKIPGGPELPLAVAASEAKRFHNRTHRIDPQTWTRILTQCRTHQVTPSALLLTLYAHALARWSSTAHFSLALTLFEAPPKVLHADGLLGDYTSVNIHEFDSRGATSDSLLSAVEAVNARIANDLDHSEYSGVEVLREIARRRGGESFLFAPFVFTSALGGDASRTLLKTDETISPVFSLSSTPQVLLDHQVLELNGELILRWDAREAAFVPNLLDEAWETYIASVCAAANDETWQARVDLRPRRTLGLWTAYNDTQGAFSGAPLHEAVLQQLRGANASRVAVATPSASISYSDLDRMVRGVAERLRGLRRGTLVPIVMNKGWEQVVAAIGILSAGGAYVPIDANLPPQRIQQLLEQISATRIVIQPAYAEAASRFGLASSIVIDKSLRGSSALDSRGISANDVAYVIFTSGSTGVPKGVVIEHGAVTNTIEDLNARIRMTELDAVFGISSLSFDLSVYDIFGTLGAGGKLVLPSAEHLLDPVHWLQLCEEHGVTIWNSVPALAQLFNDAFAQRPNADDVDARERKAPIRIFMMSGDWIPLPLVPALKKSFEHAAVLSMGGATEASIWSIAYDVNELEPAWRSVPYGRPMRNQKFFVLNERLEPTPESVVGELYIGGVGLAREYLGDAEKTERSFFRHPTTNERLYRTGDFGRLLASGDIEFLGRRDGQVKLHGNRIELGDVEAALLSAKTVREAAARIHDLPSGKQLIGYVVTTNDDVAFDRDAVLQAARARLPGYMVPSEIVKLPRLPLTANGKVDRGALPRPSMTEEEEPLAKGAPVGSGGATTNVEVEALVLETYKKILGRATIAMTDNFFSLGGDSLRAVQIALGLRKLLGTEINGRDVLQNPTPRALARIAEKNEKKKPAVKNDEATGTSEHPVSRTQAHILDTYRESNADAGTGSGAPVYHVILELTLQLDEPLSVETLQSAVDTLVRSEPVLRSSFIRTGGAMGPWRQVVHASASVPIRQMGEKTSDDCFRELKGELFKDAETPLLRVRVATDSMNRARLYWVHHHAILDGWSNWIILPRLLSLYTTLRRGGSPSVEGHSPRTASPQAAYVALEAKMPRRSLPIEPATSIAFADLPPKRGPRASVQFGSTRTTISIESAEQRAARDGVLLQSVLLHAYAEEVARLIPDQTKRPSALSIACVTNRRSIDLEDADTACGFFWRYGTATVPCSEDRDRATRTTHDQLVALDGVLDENTFPTDPDRWIAGFNFVHFHHAIQAISKLEDVTMDRLIAFDRYAFPVYLAVGMLGGASAGIMLYSDDSILSEDDRVAFLQRLSARLQE